MKPTIEDLQRLVEDARREHGAKEDDAASGGANFVWNWAESLRALIASVFTRSPGPFTEWRSVWLHIALLSLRAAWEAGRLASPPAWHLNVGGKLAPVDGPKAADTPTAKSVDVEALLMEADRRKSLAAMCTAADIHGWLGDRLAGHLAAALRAERERSYEANNSAYDAEQRMLASSGHLRAVLGFMWPGSGGPTVVQKARAFLAGEEQALPRRDEPCFPDSPQGMHDELEYMRKERDMYRGMIAEKGAALERMVDRYTTAAADLAKANKDIDLLRAQLATMDKAYWQGTVRVLEDLVGRIQGELIAEQTAHRTTKGALDDARAAIAAEDEAHAHTRARLAEVERYVDENVEARKQAVIRCAQAQAELAVLDGAVRDALAVQNRAESSLRIEVADLRRKLAEGDLMVNQLVAWSKKGRA